ncbi:histidine phosphatase family protein [Paraglaciecola sp. 2405UD69-4]|uniref:histidine phosphatase family protein n=1 Tax=Paraglaciecola sp. 2405UD69-4 TaxID=3391836 RepID=UPI0039C8EB28
MAEFYIVRHGQASFGAENYDKLSALGQRQAEWLGEYFQRKNITFSHAFRGDMVRHKETMQGICSKLSSLPKETLELGFNEFDFQNIVEAYLSIYPNEALAEDAQPALFYRLLKQSMLSWSKDLLPKDRLTETWQEFRARVQNALDRVCQSPAKQPILIVSSGGVIAMLLSLILELKSHLVMELNMQVKNTSFSHFYFNKNGVRLASFNNIPHLENLNKPDIITFS